MAYLSLENQAVIDRLPVMNKFPEVFPDEIPDVPPVTLLFLFKQLNIRIIHLFKK